MATRMQVLSIFKRRLLSAADITRPPPSMPPRSILSPQFNTRPPSSPPRRGLLSPRSGNGKFFLSVTKTEKIDCLFKIEDLIVGARKLSEGENIAIMLHNCKTNKQLKQVHLQMLIKCVTSDDDDSFSSNYSLLADKLMLLSSDLVSFDYAYRVFMDLPSNPSLPSYNTLIKCSIGKSDKIAVSAYNRMRNNQDNVLSPDRFTLAFLLKSLAPFHRLESGETVHVQVIKLGFVSNAFVMNSLLEFYFEFVQDPYIRAVGKLFDEMRERDIVSWNTMISGLVFNFLYQEALSVFDKMLLVGCKPDETTLIKILFACSHDDFIEPGKWLDAYIKENKFVLSLSLGNALIEMFLSFKDLGNAKMVFMSMSKRCTTTWQRMLSGLVGHRFCKEALVLFDTMCCCPEEVEGGIQLNNDFFWWVLLAFEKDERLLGDGKQLFRVIHQIVHGFGVKPNKEHYELMIWILSRAGWVEAAMILVESLPGRASDYNSIWGNALFECQVHGNNLLLDSLIRKMYDITSATPDYLPSTHFLISTLKSYIVVALRKKPGDVNYAKSMVETLIRKLPDQKHVEELNKYLERTVEGDASSEAYIYNQRYDHSSVHAQQTFHHHHHDDVFKLTLKSLDNLHDQMIDIIVDPFLAS